jgi:hypothetical protein
MGRGRGDGSGGGGEGAAALRLSPDLVRARLNQRDMRC